MLKLNQHTTTPVTFRKALLTAGQNPLRVTNMKNMRYAATKCFLATALAVGMGSAAHASNQIFINDLTDDLVLSLNGLVITPGTTTNSPKITKYDNNSSNINNEYLSFDYLDQTACATSGGCKRYTKMFGINSDETSSDLSDIFSISASEGSTTWSVYFQSANPNTVGDTLSNLIGQGYIPSDYNPTGEDATVYSTQTTIYKATSEVPAPLPLLSAGAAFGSIRKLRKFSSQLKTFSLN